jgi:LysW-gamma-L-lysine carboxypeptidase
MSKNNSSTKNDGNNLDLNKYSEELKFLKKILQIESPSGKEKEIANFYSEFLKSKGFTIVPSKIGNVIATKGAGNPTLLLASHIDTIAGELNFRETSNAFFARGAVDCKPSWASMLFSAASYDWDGLFKSLNNNGRVILLGVVQEEISQDGMKEFFTYDYKPTAAIFAEPGKNTRICNAYRGRIHFKSECQFPQGHAASSWNYYNAIEVMVEFWENLKKIGKTYIIPIETTQDENDSKHFDETTLTLTKMNGGKLSNATPAHCEIEVDIRIPLSVKKDDCVQKIKDIQKLIEQKFKIKIKTTFSSVMDAKETNVDAPLVNALRWGIFKVLNEKPKILKKTGSNFFNLIAEHYNIPVITYGPGDSRLEHTDDEFISKAEYIETIEVYRTFFSKYFELENKNNK